MIDPEDDGPADLSPEPGQVLVANASVFRFVAPPVSSGGEQESGECPAVHLARDGEVLREGVDYTLSWQSSTDPLRISPVNGSFSKGRYDVLLEQAKYQITVMGQSPVIRRIDLRLARDFDSHLRGHALTDAETFVGAGARWKYLDDGTDQGTAWHQVDFDDSAWKSGQAPLGYGDGDEATVVGQGPDASSRFPTVYFRHTFQVENSARIHTLRLDLRRDDGAIAYLNGKKLVHANLPTEVGYQTWAERRVHRDDEFLFTTYMIDTRHLIPGANCLAVEVHQYNRSDSDLTLDLRLTVPPCVLLTLNGLFGNDVDQIPPGSKITHANMKVAASGAGSDAVLFRLLDASPSNGTGIAEQSVVPEGNTRVTHRVQSTVQAWCDGEVNHGWALLRSSDKANSARGEIDVELTVHFIPPRDVAQVAWLLATCADSHLRDPAAALKLAERAVKYAGEDAQSWTALGAALHRAERWEEAVSALKTAEGLPNAPPAGKVIRSMAMWQLGNQEEARQLYDRAMEAVPSDSEDRDSLSVLIAEATTLMGVADE